MDAAAVAEDEAVEVAAEDSKDMKTRDLQSPSSNLEQFHTPARYSNSSLPRQNHLLGRPRGEVHEREDPIFQLARLSRKQRENRQSRRNLWPHHRLLPLCQGTPSNLKPPLYPSFQLDNNMKAESFAKDKKFFCDPAKLLPLSRFLPQPKKPAGKVAKPAGYVLTSFKTIISKKIRR